MTSLVDVIFLLLLFFMLSSTFTKFNVMELTARIPSGGAGEENTSFAFVQLSAQELKINGARVAMSDLKEQLDALKIRSVVISLNQNVTSQRLVDLLVYLKQQKDLSVTVLRAQQ